MTLTGGSFTSNTAVYGGGMYNEDEATLDGTTFQQNTGPRTAVVSTRTAPSRI